MKFQLAEGYNRASTFAFGHDEPIVLEPGKDVVRDRRRERDRCAAARAFRRAVVEDDKDGK
jgi:hypothetical protein